MEHRKQTDGIYENMDPKKGRRRKAGVREDRI